MQTTTRTLDQPTLPRLDRRSELGFFEQVYRDASGDISLVPWARAEAHPALTAWLNAEAPCLVRPGSRVAVVGCGLGDDAMELAQRGFDVTAFDAAPSAIAWVRRRFPELADRFHEADVCAPPPRWRHRFDLVVEINTLPWTPQEARHELIRAVTDLVHPNGVTLIICPCRDDATPSVNFEAPMSPLSQAELLELMRECSFEPTREIDDFTDDQNPPERWLRGAFRRAG